MLPSGFDRTATYIGASGRSSTWPLRIGQEAPASVTMPSGEVRALVMIAHVETEAPSDPLSVATEMEVAA